MTETIVKGYIRGLTRKYSSGTEHGAGRERIEFKLEIEDLGRWDALKNLSDGKVMISIQAEQVELFDGKEPASE